jgi:hypothetical protein
MTIAEASRPAGDKRVWDLFLKALRDQGVKQARLSWYAFRTVQYRKALQYTLLERHSTADVTGYLQEIGRTTRLKDWQYRQLVDALRVLFTHPGTVRSRHEPQRLGCQRSGCHVRHIPTVHQLVAQILGVIRSPSHALASMAPSSTPGPGAGSGTTPHLPLQDLRSWTNPIGIPILRIQP